MASSRATWIGVLVLLLGVAVEARAATPQVVGGQLVGATGVDVGGLLYDVSFVDGTCIAVLNGCDTMDDASFGTQAEAELASQALLDQVLIDAGSGAFDSTPALTNGCTDAQTCSILSVSYVHVAHHIAVGIAHNHAPGGSADGVEGKALGLPIDTSLLPDGVFAVWTPQGAPAPGAPALWTVVAVLAAGLRAIRVGSAQA